MKKHLANPKKPIYAASSSIVRIVCLILLTLTVNFSVFAVNDAMLGQRVQLQVENVTLKDAFKEIEKQSEFTFLYNDASINVNQIISVNTDELAVNELLDHILNDKGIKYTIIDNQIVLTQSKNFQDEKKTVTGKITDSDTGDGLPGVTILEKGTTNGTITDLDGNYTLTVAENATLVLSYVGYVTEEIPVAGQTTVDYAMLPDLISLEDVVVIGYGTVKKSDLTGAVSKVDEGLMTKTPAPDINQALQGKTAGVYITSNSGSPGAGTTVRIRGVGTITNSDPLYVVDGVMLSASEVNFLNPEDIESMQILKDASATAIYGSRGANGVVLVTTKNGKAGQSRIQLSYYQGVNQPMEMIEMADADQFSTIMYRIDHPDERDAVVEAPDTAGNTNWFNEVFRDAPVRNLYFSATNGNENSSYHFSASYLDQQGIIINSGFKRLNLKLNTKQKHNNWTFGQQVLYNNNTKSVVPENDEYTSVMANAISVDPLSKPYIINDEGERVFGPSIFSNYNNPVSTAKLGAVNYTNGRFSGGNYDLIRNRILGTFYGQFQPWDFLTLKSQFAAKMNFDKYETFVEQYYIETGYENPNSILFNRFATTQYWNWENTATLNHTFADRHDVTLLLGTTAENNAVQWVEARNDAGRGLENDIPELRQFIYYPDTSDQVNGNRRENSLVSYLGRLNYSFDGKYYLTLSVRRDGSSKFGTEYEKNAFNKGRWGTFPSFALMWKVSNEPFFPDGGAVSSLNVRYGYGLTGNQNIGSYPYVSTVATQYARYVFDQQGMTIAQGAFPFQGSNNSVHWETTKQSNFGVDAGFFQQRLTVSADFFTRTTEDMLWQQVIPNTVGIASPPYQNLGDVKNTGVELTTGFKHVQGDLSFNINGNVSYIKNEVTFLNGDALDAGRGFGDNDVSFVRVEEGQPIGYFYGYVSDGLFQNWDEVNRSTQNWAQPGDIRFVDINNDGAITSADRTKLGSPHPDWTFGLNATVNYKWFDLSMFWQGTQGNEIFFPWVRWIYEGSLNGRNYHVDVLDAWTPDNTDTDIPVLDSPNNDNFKWSDRMVYDGSYIRLKTLELGFTLPKGISEKLRIENLRVYVNGTNLLTFTKYPWFDPEVGRTQREEDEEGFTQVIYGVDYGVYPQSKGIIGGIQLSF